MPSFRHFSLDPDSSRYLRQYDAGTVILVERIPVQATNQNLEQLLSRIGITYAVFHWPARTRAYCHLSFGHPDKANAAIEGLRTAKIHRTILHAGPPPIPWSRRQPAVVTTAPGGNIPAPNDPSHVEIDTIPSASGSSTINNNDRTATTSTYADTSFSTYVNTPVSTAHVANGTTLDDTDALEGWDYPCETETTTTPALPGNTKPQAKTPNYDAQLSLFRIGVNNIYQKEWNNEAMRNEEGRQVLCEDYRQLEEVYAEANNGHGVCSGPRMRTDEFGITRFHNRQYPSPGLINKNVVHSFHVVMTKSDQETEGSFDATNHQDFITVSEKDIPNMQLASWKFWGRPARPMEKGKVDKDTRKVQPLAEINNISMPHGDTKILFRRELELLANSKTTSRWSPGQLIGGNINVNVNPSLSSVYIPPTRSSDNRTTTLVGYTQRHRRPNIAGLGWGDYDRFYEWQSYGRQITREDVIKHGYNSDSTKPFEYVFALAPSQVSVRVDHQLIEKDEIEEKPALMTLWKKLNPNE